MRDIAYDIAEGDLVMKDGDFAIASEEDTASQNGMLMLYTSVISTFNPVYGVNMYPAVNSNENVLFRKSYYWNAQMFSDGASSSNIDVYKDVVTGNYKTEISCKYPETLENPPKLIYSNFEPTKKEFTHKAQSGETIVDVCLKETGSITNIQKIMNANDFKTASPVLIEGQIVKIPAGVVIDSNVLNQFQNYENTNFADNGFIPFDTLQQLALDFENLLPTQNP